MVKEFLSSVKRFRMLKSEKETAELLEYHNEIFKPGILKYYMIRPEQNYVKIYALLSFLLIISSQRKLKMTVSQIILIVIHK